MENVLTLLTEYEDDFDLLTFCRHRRTRAYITRENHFQKWSDHEFKQRFRLSKEGVRFLVEKLPNLKPRCIRKPYLTAEEKILITLRFYATGSFLQVMGDFLGVGKTTASCTIWSVTKEIAKLCKEYIHMPNDIQDINKVTVDFFQIARFPRCVGSVDCTHIKIISPGGDQAEVFRNRKGFFSFNVQAICDARGRFLNIVARWPGSAHDATIFDNSNVRREFENGEYNGMLLLGDSGYPTRNYLITPLANPQTLAEHRFNDALIKTRNPIERTFGIWKRRFPILSLGIRLNTLKIEGIIVATAVLHNLCIFLKDPLPEEIDQINDVPDELNIEMPADNNTIRQQLINDDFASV